MKRFQILGFICLMSVGCSYNTIRLPNGARMTRISFFQEASVENFEFTTNNLKVIRAKGKTQPEVVEAVATGVVKGVKGF